MANLGLMLGGIAEGAKTAADIRQADESLGLKRDTLLSDNQLRNRSLDLEAQRTSQNFGIAQRQLALQEQGQKNLMHREILSRTDKQISDTLGIVDEVIKEGLAANKDPAAVSAAVQPLVESAKKLATAGGLDPGAVDVKVRAWMARPSATEAATGKASAGVTAAKQVAEATSVPIETALQGQGVIKQPTGADAVIDDATAGMIAEQALAGDTSAMQNWGRGAQGASNLTKIRKVMADKMAERGMTGEDLAKKNAEFGGTKAGERVKGSREANLDIVLKATEAAIPAALEQSEKVARTGWVPINRIIQRGEIMASDPELRKFGMANLQLAEHWARAMNPTGVMRESDRDMALGFLSTADSPQTYRAVVGQLKTQIEREKAAVSKSPSPTASPAAAPKVPEPPKGYVIIQ
jgi:hypothetical protein